MTDLEYKLKSLGVSNYKIRDNGNVIVLQDIHWESMDLEEIPVQFYSIDGEFNLKGNRLKNLRNFPQFITKNAILSYNRIETLEDIPSDAIMSGLILDNNMLKTLKGAPYRVETFSIDNNHLLNSLLYAPSAKSIFVRGLKCIPDEELAIYMYAISEKTWDASLSIRDNFKALIRAHPQFLNDESWHSRIKTVLEDTKNDLRGSLSGVKFGI